MIGGVRRDGERRVLLLIKTAFSPGFLLKTNADQNYLFLFRLCLQQTSPFLFCHVVTKYKSGNSKSQVSLLISDIREKGAEVKMRANV